ncbi:ankyrin repeat domain-containing protein [Phanerochaete sordida]|uniref:Ankyrin repeat domain-containing protein n=1 Tax=Phanerochaete sordida TaxID=48140 RepID=A0A9P3GNF4_9APHY|nr:ankyrin repeat domain-containing protein [Phanerochaete sordida]
MSSSSKDDRAAALHKSLLQAAAEADETAFLAALDVGADVNAEDPNGHNVVSCAIAGERWQDVDATAESFMLSQRLAILKALLRHDRISLSVLNAPIEAMRGITPLGLAAWLNAPEVVRMLLCECPGLIAVDGMDASGATPLMYAARDGRTEVVYDLLSLGARPDYRDLNHRSSIQFAQKHPQILWLCESALRRRRISDSAKTILAPSPTAIPIECHPRLALKPSNDDLLDMVSIINSAIQSNDFQQLSACLFPLTSPERGANPPPILVNLPDAAGRSPIHHCMATPDLSLEVLDALYLAGADVSLHSRSGEGSPLHCLARFAQPGPLEPVQAFVRHLVLDLRAPLASQDAAGETCIHVAAEHGHSADVLAALLACDTTESVRETRNSRGLTALEVAKPHLKVAFGINAEIHRSASAASARTIKPSTASSDSANSLLRTEVLRRRAQKSAADAGDMRDSLSELNHQLLPHCVLENLLTTSRQLSSHTEDVDIREVEELLQKTEGMGEDLLVHLQARLTEVSEELQVARRKFSATHLYVKDVEQTMNATNTARAASVEDSWFTLDDLRRRTTDSASSGWTAVSRAAPSGASSKLASDSSSVLYTHGFSDSGVALPGADTPLTAATFPGAAPAPTLRSTKSMVDLRASAGAEDRGLRRMFASWTKDGARPRSKTDSAAASAPGNRASCVWLGEPARDPLAAGVSRVKAWLRRKLGQEDAPAPARAQGVDESTARGRGAGPAGESVVRPDIAAALHVVRVAHRDLDSIQEDIETAERYVDHTVRSISQARQLLAKSLDNRRMQCFHAKRVLGLQHASAATPFAASIDALAFPPVTIPASPRDSTLVFPKPPSVYSMSTVSLSAVIEEDEDGRALRRLLTRKIEARTENALAYAHRAATGLRVVKDVARTLRKNMPS